MNTGKKKNKHGYLKLNSNEKYKVTPLYVCYFCCDKMPWLKETHGRRS